MANDINETNQNNDEENFGLPDIEYKPLDQLEQKQEPEPVHQDFQSEEEQEPEKKETYTPKYSPPQSYEEEEKSSAPAVIAIIIGIVILVGGVLVWKFVYQPRKEKEAKALQAKIDKENKEKADREAKAREEEEQKRRDAEAAANAKPAIGTIETLSARTSRYYVIVSSAVDGDLIMDNAKKLSAKGVSIKIIPPFGKWKFYRLTVGDFDSFASAQSSADASKGEYGPATWVMKY